jgi:hypothetical protein
MVNCCSFVHKVFFTTLSLGLCIPLSAGLNVDFSTWFIQDQNAFQNYEAISDFIIEPSATISYNKSWKNSRIRGFYEGGYAHFQEYDQRVFQTHYGGLAFHQIFGESGSTLSAGFQSGLRANHDSIYAYYDYGHQIAYLNWRKVWRSRGMTLAGFWGQQRRYQQIPEFNFQELRFFLQQNLFFKTRTTVIGRIQFGTKRFLESRVDNRLVQETVIRMDNPGSAETGNSRGQGRGAGGRSDPGNTGTTPGGGTGNGRGETDTQSSRMIAMVDTTVEIVEHVVRVETPGQEVMQLKCSLRIAQSVSTSTGLAVEGRLQRRIQGEGRLLSYQDSGYESDDPLADDPYNYESQSLALECSQKLFWRMLIRAGWSAEWKDYAFLALNLDGELIPGRPVRKDTRSLIWFRLTKQFALGRWASAEISVSYHLIDNESNEAYSDYQDQIFTLGWRVGI